jgi:alkyl hydroperoxide reductase subunit AhpC
MNVAAMTEVGMTLQLADEAPDFDSETTHGRIRFHEWLGSSWGLLFSHPRDFTPVCTTELGSLARLHHEFAARNVKVIALSGDTVPSHLQWMCDIRQLCGVPVHFPIISDLDRSIAKLYGMLHPQHSASLTVRSVFIIDPQKKVRMTLTYPQSCGRNFAEILRVIQSLQRTQTHRVYTPSDWEPSDDVIIPPELSDAEAHALFPQGWESPLSYVRVAADVG